MDKVIYHINYCLALSNGIWVSQIYCHFCCTCGILTFVILKTISYLITVSNPNYT
jgi:hypothetical protein